METAEELTGNLSDEQGRLLPALAREALLEILTDRPSTPRDDAWLLRPAATFVTLHQVPGRLRGCIGATRATKPLLHDLRENTRAAALEDPRFPPLTAQELQHDPVSLSVSLLSPLAPVRAASEADLLGRLRPGVDGLVLEWGRCCGTFLPQVWRQLPEPADFLAHLRRKAGLPERFWAPDLRVWTFTVRSWQEEG